MEEDPEDFNDDELIKTLTPEQRRQREEEAQRRNYYREDLRRRKDMADQILSIADEVQRTTDRLEGIEQQLIKASERETMIMDKVRATLSSFIQGVDEKIKSVIGGK